ncbi:MAG: SDR family oxidoreductase [Acidobacteria bacterium]|nr:SDR family oxidoreductase [Acidobacteriota bacterium]
MRPRALVTGGAGFLGSHLADALLAEGYAVVAVDNLLTGRMSNIEHLRREGNFEFLQLDINRQFECGEVNYVFHLASPASPVDYMVHGIETLKVGSLGTLHALEIAQKNHARYLLASTSECYGDPLEHPQKETYWGNVNSIGPRSVYDEAKRFSEALTMAFHRYHAVDTRIARVFNTYGPRMQVNDGRVIPNFMKQALRGEDLTVYGDGTQTRSFCYVSDEIDGLLHLAASNEHFPVNLGNPSEFTILDCAQRVIQVVGSQSQIRFGKLPQDDPKQRRPDITKANRLLGWNPKIDLDSGLRMCLDYFRDAVSSETASSLRAPL